MVYNFTIPKTETALPHIPTRRERLNGMAETLPTARFDGKSKRELLESVREIRKEKSKHIKERQRLDKHLMELDACITAYDDIKGWLGGFFTFERPDAGAAMLLRQAFANAEVLDLREYLADRKPLGFDEVFEDGEIFRVEHDWHSAIKKADQFEGGSFLLPFETCLFEFKISRRRVVAFCFNNGSDAADNEVVMQIAVETLVGWTLLHNIYRHAGGSWEALSVGQRFHIDGESRLVELIGNQIRAACIALDAEVASSETVRESYVGRGQNQREHPAYEFYAIRLARKARAAAFTSGVSGKGHRRLHFRRGHWRHYANFKTWVRWCLVGDPDLGFIDKQYRL